MRLEEGKNWVEKTCSFVYAQRRTHTYADTHSCTQSPRKHSFPFTALFLKQLGSIYVCKAPSIPKPYPFIFSFQVLLQLMRTGKEGGMFIAGRQLGNSE